MRQVVKTLRTSTFVRHNAIFFTGSMAIGLLNYLYYPVLGRLLNPGNFGEVQVLFSLFAQVSILFSALGLLTVNIVANYDNETRRNRMIVELEKLGLIISTILLVVTIFAAPALQRFFHFYESAPFVILMLAVVVAVPLMFRSAFLRGCKQFGLASLVGMITSSADLIVSVIFVLAGWKTTGAIAGLVVAQAIALVFATRYARSNGFTEALLKTRFRLPDFRLMYPELRYASLVLVGSLGVTALYSIDSIAVKHFFDARTAGVYAGISTVARILFFVTAPVVGVLVPSIRMQQSSRENQKILQKSLALLVTIGGMALVVFAVMPKIVIRLLMGPKYLPDAYLLPRLSLVIFTISLLNLFIMYHIALRRYAMLGVVVVGFVATLFLLSSHHQTVLSVINSLLVGSLIMLALLAVWLGVDKFKYVEAKAGG